MRTIQIILLILIIVGVGLLCTQKYWVESLVNFILQQSENNKNDPLNITFTISGKSYTLTNGKVEKEIAVFGEPVYGDLNGDGVNDAVMYLTQETGGSGTFFYVVEAINYNGFYKGTNAMLLGDRIAPQNINIMDGRAVANFAERKPGEPFATQPSIGKSVYVYYDAKTGEIGELVENFEGESANIKKVK
jgi:hypothetical protein